MTDQEFEAIAGGYHGDPFAVLGPHALESNPRAEWEIRAFLPHAKEVALALDGKSIPMERAHTAGLFTVRTASEPAHYRFLVTDHQGGISEQEDAYRFPPVISDFDLHLIGEGTNYEGYNSLGAHVVTVAGIEGTRFAVWAPNAIVVSVVGDFNGWDNRRN